MIPNWPRDSKGRLLPKKALPADFVPADADAVKERLKQAKPNDAGPRPEPTKRVTPVEAEKLKEQAALTQYEPTPALAEAIGGTLRFSFDVIAKRLGPHWHLTEDETNGLGVAYGRLFNKYQSNANYLPELLAIGVTGGVLGRIWFDMRAHPPKPHLKPMKRDEKPKPKEQADASGS